MPSPVDGRLLDDLEARGLVAVSTDRDALQAHLSAGPTTFYCGFDPTAPSLHHGNLLQLVTMRRLQKAGHSPLALVGGSTGLIGDPKLTGERNLNPADVVAGWVERVAEQVTRFLDLEGPAAAVMVNNLDWTADVGVLEFLRDIGKHFPVNRMLDRETVRARLDSGISYTEFSYVLLQSMDFLELHRRYGCTLQIGGSDQWGNITAGVELVRRADGDRVHALATPLVTKADGTKFGKTESGTVWLDAELTSPYAFYQFWLNAEDARVGHYLQLFSFRPLGEIEELEAEGRAQPAGRAPQRALAHDVTTLVHGSADAAAAEQAAVALFGRGDLGSLPEPTLRAALRETPHVEVDVGLTMPSIAHLLLATGLADSRSAARRTITDGGAFVNNERVTDPEAMLTERQLLHRRWVVLRRGKRNVAGVGIRR